MKASKKSLLASGVALLASAALLAGTTFAWFTDSVVNTGNKIQAGNLAIGAYAYDLAEDGEGGFVIEGVNGGNPFKFKTEGQNLKKDETPIISEELEELFEPGKSNAKLLKVENEGTLAAKIKVDFTVEDGGLTEALWFDFVKVENGEVKGNFTRRPMNTLETFAENLELPLLENGDNVQFILVYGMYESAGNAFKDKSFTADVAILATQYTKEEDGFGNDQYDKGAKYPVITEAASAEEFKDALNSDVPITITVKEDIDSLGSMNVTGDVTVDLTGMTEKNDEGVHGDSMTVENGGKLTVNGSWVTGGRTSAFAVKEVVVTGEGSTATFNNVHFGASSGANKTAITATDGGKVVITGGYYTTSGNPSTVVLADGGTVEITGGIFRGSGNQGPVFAVKNGGKIVIAKDIYENKVSQTTHQIIASDCVAVLDGDNYIITQK